MRIHPTAIVHPTSELANDVEVGPYSFIGKNVTVGEGTKIGVRVYIDGWTVIGKKNHIFTGAIIGSEPQDLKFKGEKTFLRIGDGNTIREYVTINRGTKGSGGETIIGSQNLLMAYCHVAHDCHLGSGIVMANAAILGGHVTIEDKVYISGLAGVHHFVTIGELAMVGGCSKVVQDIPPFMIADGRPAQVKGLNVIGLRRNNYSPEARATLKKAYRILYRSHLSTSRAISKVEEEVELTEEVSHLLEFMRRRLKGALGRAKEPKK